MKFLNTLLAPVKAVDERILKGYTEVSQKIPDDKLYKITTGLTLSSLPLQGIFYCNVFMNNPLARVSSIMGNAVLFNGENLAIDMCGLTGQLEKDNVSNEVVSENPAIDFLFETTRLTRLPLFIAGVSLLGKSVYDVGNWIFNGEPLTSETLNYAGGGFGYLSLASSMYLKDRNPKLLQKKPLWKSALEYAKDKTRIKIPVKQEA